MKKKILVGLSGGVDSAVAAYLLKEQGWDVICAFMRNWDSYANQDIYGNPTIKDDICPQEQDFIDAQAVAKKLNLPLLRVDFVEEYWNEVFLKFLDEYKVGRTPNPDILCNQYIKFDAFFNYAKSLGFSNIATGHYAQVMKKNEEFVLMRGQDDNKDQSYFLCQISPEALKATQFPIGNLEKDKVRAIAKKFDLSSVSLKKDSTGICFIGERNFRQFLQNYIPSKTGEIVDIVSLSILGKHDGVLFYTVGQRKGLGIGGTLGPWFVIGKDVYKNILYVSNKNEEEWLNSDACEVINPYFFSKHKITLPFKCTAKFRYRQKDIDIIIEEKSDNKMHISYPNYASAVTCGQEAVFYDKEVCLGGGVINRVFRNGIDINDKILERIKNGK